jgi:hypothetical protein
MIDYRNAALGSQYTSLFNMSEFSEQFAPAPRFAFCMKLKTSTTRD